MSTLWTAASVTATNGSNLITVQSGEDIAAIRANSWIMVGSSHIMEIKRTFVTDSGVKTIELFDDWEFGPISGQRATVAPSLGEFKTLADDVRRLIQIGEEQINTASVAPEPDSSVKRSEKGTVKTAEPQDDADAVRLQDFAPVKQKGESNENAISSNSLAILRQRAMAKLERDAVFLGKFTEGRVVKSVGLSKVATSIAEGITYTSPDGVTGVAANGTIQTADVNQPAIVYDAKTGECLGLQTAPGTTNLEANSEDFTQLNRRGNTTVTAKTDQTCPLDNKTVFQLDSSDGGVTYVNNTYTTVAGETYSFSRFVKFETGEEVYGFFTSETSAIVVSLNASGDPAPSILESDFFAIKHRGGWWRIGFLTVAQSSSMTVQCNVYAYPASNVNASTGIQFEQGYLTPYQSTAGSQITRASVRAGESLGQTISVSQGFTLFFHGVPLGIDAGGNDFFVPLLSLVGVAAGSETHAATIQLNAANQRVDGKIYNYNSAGDDTSSDVLAGEVEFGNEIIAALVYDPDSQEVRLFANGESPEARGAFIEDEVWNDVDSVIFGSGLRYYGDVSRTYLTTKMNAVVPYPMTNEECLAITTPEGA